MRPKRAGVEARKWLAYLVERERSSRAGKKSKGPLTEDEEQQLLEDRKAKLVEHVRSCSTEEHAIKVENEIRVSVTFRNSGDTAGLLPALVGCVDAAATAWIVRPLFRLSRTICVDAAATARIVSEKALDPRRQCDFGAAFGTRRSHILREPASDLTTSR